MKRPLIVFVLDRKVASSGPWNDVTMDTLPHSYTEAITAAGGSPLALPAVNYSNDEIERILGMADGVLLPGGRDIDAALYGEEKHDQNDTPLRSRDDLEILLVRGAQERGIPVLGVCRGMQLINVAMGGSLHQHLDDVTEMKPHRDQVGTFTNHSVQILEESLLRRILKRDSLHIASHHHQAVKVLGRNLVVAAMANDGIVEALEYPSADYLIGVEWHPEEQYEDEGKPLFEAFIEATIRYARSVESKAETVESSTQ